MFLRLAGLNARRWAEFRIASAFFAVLCVFARNDTQRKDAKDRKEAKKLFGRIQVFTLDGGNLFNPASMTIFRQLCREPDTHNLAHAIR